MKLHSLITTSFFAVMIVCVLLLLFKQAFGNEKPKNEKECFMGEAYKMKRFLKRVDSIKPRVTQQKNGTVLIETKEITGYVLKHKDEFVILLMD